MGESEVTCRFSIIKGSAPLTFTLFKGQLNWVICFLRTCLHWPHMGSNSVEFGDKGDFRLSRPWLGGIKVLAQGHKATCKRQRPFYYSKLMGFCVQCPFSSTQVWQTYVVLVQILAPHPCFFILCLTTSRRNDLGSKFTVCECVKTQCLFSLQ